jgi:glycosyltransferase involved in cell wall biosynthesis
MVMFYWIFGMLLGVAWLWRAIENAVHLHEIPDLVRPDWDAEPTNGPRVSIIVPARNEEEGIGSCLRSLLALDYANYQIVAVNDRSTDRTGAIMDEVALSDANIQNRLRVHHVKELPAGWLGKTHAMWKGAALAIDGSLNDEWILFTDGDIVYRQDTLRRAVGCVEKTHGDHFVLFPTMVMKDLGERMMISMFQSLLTLGVRIWKVSDPKAKDFIGAGAFNMVRRSVYDSVGTYEAMRLAVVDDLRLGQTVKENGFASRLAFGHGLISVHWAKGALGIANNLTKNFFAVFRYDVRIALAAILLTAIFNWGPWVGVALAPGWSSSGFFLALTGLALVYTVMGSQSKLSPLYMLLHPIAIALILYAMCKSVWTTLRQGGVIWRGTKYELAELKESVRD